MPRRRGRRQRRKSSALKSWGQVKEKIKEKNRRISILIGNGASQAVWKDFNYRSLYRSAVRNGLLSKTDERLFQSLKTENFEHVLRDLAISIDIVRACRYKCTTKRLKEKYASIQESLASSIAEVHVPWDCAFRKLPKFNESIRNYNFIFTTNYDLLLYWSSLQEESYFLDYFWHEDHSFDLGDVQVHDDENTKVLYLHGALHLESLLDGTVQKRVHNGRNLLEQFGKSANSSAVPLVVTEGSSDQKLRSILKSPYLSFAFSKFSSSTAPLVIFGHSLGPEDDHIVEALNQNPRPVAISILPVGNMEKKKGDYRSRLSELERNIESSSLTQRHIR